MTVKQQNKEIRNSKIIRFVYCLSTFLVISSVASYYGSLALIKDQIYKNVVLKNNTRAFNYWKSPPANIVRKYYLFDLRNPNEVQAGSEKPRVLERGPYSYTEKLEKRNIEFLGIDIIQFDPVATLFFDPHCSNGSESDIITILNIPALGLIEDSIIGSTKPYLVNYLTNMMDTRLFLRRSVGQLMHGYEDDLLDMAKDQMPEKVKSNRFSLMKDKNGTTWQTVSIKTGINDISDLGKVVSWNKKTKLDVWHSDNANTLNGTDGTLFAPYKSRDETVYAFNADMCRSFQMVYKEDKEIFGLNTIEFGLPSNAFANSTHNPVNEGFCRGDCLGNGVQNISSCYGGGLSGFISQPHFLNADEMFSEAIDGLHKEDDNHKTALYFEPTTGVPLKANIRFQISFYLPQSNEINLIKKVKPVLLPVLWFDEKVDIHKSVAEELGQVATITKLSTEIPIIMTFVGLAFFLFAVILTTFNYLLNKNKFTSNLAAVHISGPETFSKCVKVDL